MRKVTLLGVALGTTIMACESKTPTGPSTVTVEVTTTVPATTTVPPGSTTVPPTTTTIAPTSVTRRYLGTAANPVLPNDMTLALNLVTTGVVLDGALEGAPRIGAQATYSVTGFYSTGSGGGGTVRGMLDGTLDNGTFSGTLSTTVPGCSASREYYGELKATNLVWSAGQVLQDCKDNPLSFSTLTMITTGGGLPPTTTIPTTTVPSCNYGLNPGGASIGLAGGSGSVQVVTQPGCGWSAQSVVNWVTLQPASGSTGPGSVQYTVAGIEGGMRETTLVIAGLPFVLRQEAAPSSSTTTTTPACTYTLSPTNATLPAGGGSGAVTVITQPGCAWNVQNFVSWIVPSPTSGSGSGPVQYTVAANTAAARESSLVVGGQPFLIRQDGAPQPADLRPFTPLGGGDDFCRTTNNFTSLVVGVENLGPGGAGSSTTLVTFTPSDTEGTPPSFPFNTPTAQIAAAGRVDLTVPVPDACRFWTCRVVITVDAAGAIPEVTEDNNTVTASCFFGSDIGTRRRP